MNINLLIWAIPYAARWSLSKIGITYAIPASGIAITKPQEALQQFFAVGAGAVALAFVAPVASAVWLAVLVPIKLYNLWRIPLVK